MIVTVDDHSYAELTHLSAVLRRFSDSLYIICLTTLYSATHTPIFRLAPKDFLNGIRIAQIAA
jgi:hypothetical protein